VALTTTQVTLTTAERLEQKQITYISCYLHRKLPIHDASYTDKRYGVRLPDSDSGPTAYESITNQLAALYLCWSTLER